MVAIVGWSLSANGQSPLSKHESFFQLFGLRPLTEAWPIVCGIL